MKPKSIVLLKIGTSTPIPMTLTEVITQYKINNIYNYNGFTTGVAPAHLTPKRLVVLSTPAEGGLPELVKAVAASTKVHWVWVVEVKGTTVIPCGVALCVKEQMLLKPTTSEAV